MWLVWHVLLACGIWHLAHGTWYCLVLNGTQKALNSLAHSPAGLSRTGAGDTRTETLAHPFVAWPYANRKWCVGQLVPYLHLINIGAGLVKPDNGQSIMDTGHGTRDSVDSGTNGEATTPHGGHDGVINVSPLPLYPFPLTIQNSLQQMAHPFHLSICDSLSQLPPLLYLLLLSLLFLVLLLSRSISIIILTALRRARGMHDAGAALKHTAPRFLSELQLIRPIAHCFTRYAVAGQCVHMFLLQ